MSKESAEGASLPQRVRQSLRQKDRGHDDLIGIVPFFLYVLLRSLPGFEREKVTNRCSYGLLWNKCRLQIACGYRALETIASGKYEADMVKVPGGLL